MRRDAAAVLLVAALGGCTSFQSGPETGGGNGLHWGQSKGPPTVPGLKGPYGENIAMAAPYGYAPPASAYMARHMMNQSVPLGAVQMNGPGPGMSPDAMVLTAAMPRGPVLAPLGVPFTPGGPGSLPAGPAGMDSGVVPASFAPGNMPMGGGVINANLPPGKIPSGRVMQTQMVQANPTAGIRFQGQRTQIRFARPSGMRISWFTQGPDGRPTFSTTPIEAPGRYNFPQAAIYRLKLSNIEGRPGLEVYPTMEVVPANPKTEAFLAHSAVPIAFTDEDFKQIAEGNYLVKVIYLPDPQFQDVAGTGTDEILSTRLEPGADPIQEALRRGCILVVLRMGNVDQEAPNTPPLNAPGHQAGLMTSPPAMAQQGPGSFLPPSSRAPFWATKAGMPTPGALNVPSVPLPGSSEQLPVPPPVPAATKPWPAATETSMPKARTLSGASSTSKVQATSPSLAPVPPIFSQMAPPTVPQNNVPAFPPVPGGMQLESEGPNLPSVPPLPAPPTSDSK
jgi:hypothetical protein